MGGIYSRKRGYILFHMAKKLKKMSNHLRKRPVRRNAETAFRRLRKRIKLKP
jgi:hypothetical protein